MIFLLITLRTSKFRNQFTISSKYFDIACYLKRDGPISFEVSRNDILVQQHWKVELVTESQLEEIQMTTKTIIPLKVLGSCRFQWCYFLKMHTSENRTSEIHSSKGPCAEFLVATTLGTTMKKIMQIKVLGSCGSQWCTSESRTTEIRKSQGPCVEYLVATTLETTTKTIMPLKVTHPAHETLICSL